MIMSSQLLTSNQGENGQCINIEHDNKNYSLITKINGEEMTFNIFDKEEGNKYLRKMTLKELKENKENGQLFAGLKSCKEFYDFLKTLSEEKKLSILKSEDKLTLNFIVEYLLKKHSVKIDLFSENKNYDYLEERIKNLENENKNLKNDIKHLKEEIKEIKKIIEPINQKFKDNININKYSFNNNSVIMNKNEFDMIHLAIKSRLNKEVKELKKLYQASIDGDGPFNFHLRCDNIPNTLTIIKSAGNRRFGGFTTQVQDSPESSTNKDDKNAFLFSLDKQKIYPYNNDGYAIECKKDWGPTFGKDLSSIYVGPNFIQQKELNTYESGNKSYNFFGDKNALSEDGKHGGIYAVEMEVFQIIFS